MTFVIGYKFRRKDVQSKNKKVEQNFILCFINFTSTLFIRSISASSRRISEKVLVQVWIKIQNEIKYSIISFRDFFVFRHLTFQTFKISVHIKNCLI